jgi:peptidoglycan/LPS O-acetylase OafA/YrhL
MDHFFITHINGQNQINNVYTNYSLIIISLILLFLFVISLKKREMESGFLSIDSSNTLRGVAIILLLFHHFGSKCVDGESFLIIAGNWAVTIFLFISGIALYKTYGLNALNKKFILNRIKRLLFPTWITLSGFYLLDSLLIHTSTYTYKGIILHYLGILFPLPPNAPAWFITYIAYLYIIYYIAAKMRNGNLFKIAGMYGFCFLSSIILLVYNDNLILSNFHIWKQYTFLFPTSVLIGSYSSRINSMLLRLYKYPFIFLILMMLFILPALIGINLNFISQIFSHGVYFLIITTVRGVLFFISLIMITFLLDKAAFSSKILAFLGKYSFEIFIIHMPFMVYYDFFLFRKPLFLFFFGYLIFILLLSIALNKMTNKMNSIFNLLGFNPPRLKAKEIK